MNASWMRCTQRTVVVLCVRVLYVVFIKRPAVSFPPYAALYATTLLYSAFFCTTTSTVGIMQQLKLPMILCSGGRTNGPWTNGPRTNRPRTNGPHGPHKMGLRDKWASQYIPHIEHVNTNSKKDMYLSRISCSTIKILKI